MDAFWPFWKLETLSVLCLNLLDRKKPNSHNKNDQQRELNVRTLALCLQNARGLDWQLLCPNKYCDINICGCLQIIHKVSAQVSVKFTIQNLNHRNSYMLDLIF